MRTTIFTLSCAILAALAAQLVGNAADNPPAKQDQASIWMTRKLEHSQKVLAGLTRADFALIRKHADSMLVLTYLEKWDRADLPAYKEQLRSFEKANKDLVRHANDKNIEAATIAYTQLIGTCVRCHNVIRDADKK